MKTLPLAVALLTVHSVAQPNDELIENGTNFYSNCAADETFKEGQEKTAQVKAAYCLGFVEGLRRGIMATQTSTWNKPFCQPEDITNLQTVRIVRKFIADNPDRAQELAVRLAVEALHKAFPCPRPTDWVAPQSFSSGKIPKCLRQIRY